MRNSAQWVIYLAAARPRPLAVSRIARSMIMRGLAFGSRLGTFKKTIEYDEYRADSVCRRRA
jgi:hypothetical protein